MKITTELEEKEGKRIFRKMVSSPENFQDCGTILNIFKNHEGMYLLFILAFAHQFSLKNKRINVLNFTNAIQERIDVSEISLVHYFTRLAKLKFIEPIKIGEEAFISVNNTTMGLYALQEVCESEEFCGFKEVLEEALNIDINHPQNTSFSNSLKILLEAYLL